MRKEWRRITNPVKKASLICKMADAVEYQRQKDRELDTVVVLPFITIMAVLIAVFCHLTEVVN